MLKGFIILITCLFLNNAFCQTVTIFEPYAIEIAYKEKRVSFTSEDTSFSSYVVLRQQVSDSFFFYKITNINSKITYIKDSSGFYIYTDTNQVLAEATEPKLFFFRKVPQLMDTHLRTKFELNNLDRCDTLADDEHLVKHYRLKIDTGKVEERYFADIKTYESFVNNKLVKLIDYYEWQGFTQYREYNIEYIRKLLDTSIYNSIAIDNQPFFIRKRINADLLLTDSILLRTNLSIGTKFKNFKWQTLTGKPIELYRQNALFFILDFHYKSCYPCWQMHDILNNIILNYNSTKVKIIGINMHDSLDKSTLQFYKKKQPLYDVVFSDKKFRNDFRIPAYPMLIILDSQFNVIKTISGVSDDVTKELNTFLSEKIN